MNRPVSEAPCWSRGETDEDSTIQMRSIGSMENAEIRIGDGKWWTVNLRTLKSLEIQATPSIGKPPDCAAVATESEIMFAAMLRVKNEARWIKEVIESITPLCSKVFVFDDHSTDGTAGIANAFPHTEVFLSPFTGLDEARDKNWLYDRVMERSRPDWILCVDGDEVLEPGGQEKLRRICETGTADAYRLKIHFLWGDRNTVRVDRVYGFFYRPSVFRPFYPKPNTPDDLKLAAEFRWMSTPFGKLKNGDKPNLHCSSVPQRRIHDAPNIDVGLLHYGYMLREDRVRKLDFYTSVDWANPAEDCYRHMTQGDGVTLEELPLTRELMARGELSPAQVKYMLDTPPEARLVHAGPMEFARI